MAEANPDDAVKPTGVDQLWIVPAHKNLIGANIELVEAEGREFRLREAVNVLRERFQFIVLDCPPALDLLTLNALVAADAVLIPMQAEYFALEGISELLDTVERIRSSLNPSLEIEGVVLTMFDERTNLAQQVTAELKRFFGRSYAPRLFRATFVWRRRPAMASRRWSMTSGQRERRVTSGWRRKLLRTVFRAEKRVCRRRRRSPRKRQRSRMRSWISPRDIDIHLSSLE